MDIFNGEILDIKNSIDTYLDILAHSKSVNKTLYLNEIVSMLSYATMYQNEANIKNPSFYLANLKKRRYLIRNLNNFKKQYVLIYDLCMDIKNHLNSEIKDETFDFKNPSSINDSKMYDIICNYYNSMDYDDSIYFTCAIAEKNFYDVSLKNEYTRRSIYCEVDNRGYIFIKNNNDVETMSNIIYEISNLKSERKLAYNGLNNINEYLFYNNLKNIRPFVMQKKFLNYLKEREDLDLKEDINKYYLKLYRNLLKDIESIRLLFRVNSEGILNNTFLIKKLEYIYGHFMSDIYLYLDNEKQDEFIDFLCYRDNFLFNKDILEKLQDELRLTNYGLAGIPKIQYKKYTK